jgi:hypothetical protein
VLRSKHKQTRQRTNFDNVFSKVQSHWNGIITYNVLSRIKEVVIKCNLCNYRSYWHTDQRTALLNLLKYAAHLNKVIFKQSESPSPPTTNKILRPMIFRDMKAVRFLWINYISNSQNLRILKQRFIWLPLCCKCHNKSLDVLEELQCRYSIRKYLLCNSFHIYAINWSTISQSTWDILPQH